MEEGYGQHYESMYCGSMVGAGALVFALMGYIIAKTKPRSHTIDLNPTILSVIFGEPVESVEKAIEKLCQPDPKSRSKREEGRRLIRRGEFEYFVVNHEFYRGLATKQRRRAYMATLMANKRDREASSRKTANKVLTTANELSASASASASASVQEKGCGERGFPEVELPSWDEVKVEAVKIGLVEWKAKDFFDEMEAAGWKDRSNRYVQNWRALLSRVRTWWEADGRPMTPKKARRDRNGQTEASKQTEPHTGNY